MEEDAAAAAACEVNSIVMGLQLLLSLYVRLGRTRFLASLLDAASLKAEQGLAVGRAEWSKQPLCLNRFNTLDLALSAKQCAQEAS